MLEAIRLFIRNTATAAGSAKLGQPPQQNGGEAAAATAGRASEMQAENAAKVPTRR